MDRTILWCCSWSNVAWVSLVCTKLFRSTCCFDTAKILFAAQSIFNHMQQRICGVKYSKHNVTLPSKVKIYTCVPIGRVMKWEVPLKIESLCCLKFGLIGHPNCPHMPLVCAPRCSQCPQVSPKFESVPTCPEPSFSLVSFHLAEPLMSG